VKCNEAWWDRVVRLGLGTTLLAVGGTTGPWPLMVIGALQVITGAIGYCVLYEPFGLDTRRLGRDSTDLAQRVSVKPRRSTAR